MLHTLTVAQRAQAGIYVLHNTLDGRVYIGATQHLLTAYRVWVGYGG